MQSALTYLVSDDIFFGRRAPQPELPFECSTPARWNSHRGAEWTEHAPARHDTPAQGWKVHVSATAERSQRVLQLTAEVAVRHEIVFKHLTSHERFLNRNSKLCARQHAGKFVTLYPPDHLLESVLPDLESRLAGYEGPYILSDRRWREAPVFLRFGVFRAAADRRPALVDGRGNPVPDTRSLTFTVPQWAQIPALLQDWVTAQQLPAVGDLPFRVEAALKFSNAGGTYRGSYAGEPVIIKEARPGAGLDSTYRDAVDRLDHEAAVLRALSEIPGVPDVVAHERVWENTFLLQSLAPGTAMHRWSPIATAFRTLNQDAAEERLRRQTEVLDDLERLVYRVHSIGYAHMDLHPGNILVDPDTGNVTLIDFENAVQISTSPIRQVMAAPGYGLEGEHSARVFDLYALRQVAQLVLWPSLADAILDPHRSEHVASLIRERPQHLGVPQGHPLLLHALEQIDRLTAAIRADDTPLNAVPAPLRQSPGRGLGIRGEDPPPASWEAALVTGVRVAHRRHGSHPRHHHALRSGWSGLGYGDAAMDRIAGLQPSPLVVLRSATSKHPTGLMTGTTGDLVALSHPQHGSGLTRDLFRRLLANRGQRVFDGLPGVLIGLGTLPELRADARMLATLRATVETMARAYCPQPEAFAPIGVADTAQANRSQAFDSGLFFGHLGLAWLFARFHAETDPVVARACRQALDNELDRYVAVDDGRSLQLDQRIRTLPYLATGSAGFGVVLASLPVQLWSGRVVAEVGRLAAACDTVGSVFPGLFHGMAGLQLGRAGLLIAGEQADQGRADTAAAVSTARTALLSSLPFFAFGLDSGAVVQGDGGGRITADVATGGAGIALALHGLSHGIFDPVDAIGCFRPAETELTDQNGADRP